ncbi:hypothetical protein [Sphingomonas metalli]|nr:hypothetical protein [Sphingomonas metalli]
MAVSPALSASLRAISCVMAGAQDDWWIIGSAAVALHGADPGDVADVDVLLSVADAERILPGVGVPLRRGSGNAAFRSSLFGIWLGTGLPVEFMADFHHQCDGIWRTVRPATRQAIAVEGGMVFIPERRELQAILAAFGRPKDMARGRSLAAVARDTP